jgi:putative hydrolase of the HAD superfamily
VPFSAVLFDLGGVVFPSPFDAFDRYDTRAGLDTGFTRSLIRESSEAGAWAALERGALTLPEFFAALEMEAQARGAIVDAAAIMATIGEESGGARPEMLHAIARLRAEGLRVGALTNNWVGDTGASTPAGLDHVLDRHELFDVVVESSKVGLRKPDPRIYELALEMLGVEPQATVFLDDLGINLKPARAMGMATIKVVDHGDAIRELEALVGIALLQEAVP